MQDFLINKIIKFKNLKDLQITVTNRESKRPLGIEKTNKLNVYQGAEAYCLIVATLEGWHATVTRSWPAIEPTHLPVNIHGPVVQYWCCTPLPEEDSAASLPYCFPLPETFASIDSTYLFIMNLLLNKP